MKSIYYPATEDLKQELQATAKRVLMYRAKDRTGMLKATQIEEMLFTRLVGQLRSRGQTQEEILRIPYVLEVLRTTTMKG